MTPSYHKWLWRFAIAYACFIALICFMPQPDILELETPGIQRFGRIIVLLRPFNTLWALDDITSPIQVAWVIIQNLLNIFLLYPLVLALLLLRPTFWSMASAVKWSFLMSLTIELTQVLLSLLFNANRVFEIDDLWTNTLGGFLAWKTYVYLKKHVFNAETSL